ncbi:hypothetical protein Tco_0488533 [Tanacetum coccineum]
MVWRSYPVQFSSGEREKRNICSAKSHTKTTTTSQTNKPHCILLSKKTFQGKLPQKVRKGKPAFQLVDEEDEAQQESIPQRKDDDPDLDLAKKLSLETPQEKGGRRRRDQTPPDSTTGPSSQPEDDTSEKVIHESSSTSDSERTESDTETGAPKGDKVQGEIDSLYR